MYDPGLIFLIISFMGMKIWKFSDFCETKNM